MLRKYLFIGLLLLSSFVVHAQRMDYMYNRKPWVASADIGGRTLFWAANLERIFHMREKTFFSGEVGFSYFSLPDLFVKNTTERVFYFPHGVNFDYGKNRNYLELGMHASYVMGTYSSKDLSGALSGYMLSPIIGYRNQGYKKGLVFKGFLAILYYIPFSGGNNFGVKPFPGISIGYGF